MTSTDGRADPFRDRVALITGGSSGIGLATAQALAARGAHVWLLARDQDKLAEALASLESHRRTPEQRFTALAADVADWSQVDRALDQVEAAGGAPDLVINSAGVVQPGRFRELDLDLFRWMMETNYFGTVHVTKRSVPGMVQRGSGHIVNISSLAGILAIFGYTAYSGSKFAVRGFSDALRSELKPLGVHVSVVFPPDTDTPQLHYENRFKPAETKALAGNSGVLAPEAVAEAILAGVQRRRYMILPGMESKLLYRLSGWIGGLQYPIVDWLIARARRGEQHSS
ncbi:MAG: SDR family oxidoreductase [Anaerolineae bacterium]